MKASDHSSLLLFSIRVIGHSRLRAETVFICDSEYVKAERTIERTGRSKIIAFLANLKSSRLSTRTNPRHSLLV